MRLTPSRKLLLPLALLLPLTSALAFAPAHADDDGTGRSSRSTRPALSARAVGGDDGHRVLDRPRRGAAAVTALGDNLKTAARRNHLSATKLAGVLREDKTAWIAPNGRLFYAETAADADSAPRPVAQDIAPPTEPLASTFLLHSKPGSAHTMYLDFTGHTLAAGNEWVPNGYPAGVAFNGFSIDGTYGTFTADEQAYVQEVWRIVAEKYSAYDVDVTTQDPGSAALNRDGALDTTYGSRIVFTNDSRAKPAALCPSGCLGVAFVGSYDDPADATGTSEPAWVYTAELTDIPSYAANVAAHEVGHNLGLLHDGTLTAGDDSYFGGSGNWFPIMGAGYYAVGQFSKGEYGDANETQDDLAVIESHGVPQRPDDWGDAATPSPLGQAVTYAEDGVIENRTDVDAFTVDRTCTAPMTVRATGIGEGQALDIQLTVTGPSGTVVDDPESAQVTTTFPFTPTGLDAELIVSQGTGSYQIEVDGVGHGSALSGGYSDYASIGQYHLTITGCDGASGNTPGAPATVTTTAAPRTTTATVSWTAPTVVGDGAVTGYRISGSPEGTIDVPAGTTSRLLKGLSPGTTYAIQVSALNQFGAGTPGSDDLYVPTYLPATAPGLSVRVIRNTLRATWSTPANPGHAEFTLWRLSINGQIFDDPYGDHSGFDISGFPNGSFTARLVLFANADYGTSTPPATRTFSVGASAPRIGRAASGARGGKVTATARWAAPAVLGGYPIRGYKVLAHQLNSRGKIVRTYGSTLRSAASRSYVFRLPKGRYRFRVVALNALGYTAASRYSTIVTAR
ncbi:MAG: fibronectin type III domain-containing protein [Nocardioidaceae bacterium]|nr:fibronectin type III domain-containing protein [Nocardioidaceae bacterium]